MTDFRLLHTMIRVRDLDRSLDFYTRHLGMKVLRRQDYPGGRFTLAFVGYGEEKTNTVIELTHNWDQEEPYSSATASAIWRSRFRTSTALVGKWRRKGSTSPARRGR